MEIKGDEFIKKVQLKQEREELEQKLSEIEEVETSINRQQQQEIPRPDRYENTMDLNDQELGNIMLENSTSNEENKKKYLILGLVLVVLFLLTIIIIRLLTDSSTKEDSFTSEKTDPIEVVKTTEDKNIEENFQKIMNERIKKETSTTNEDNNSEDRVNSIEESSIKKTIEPSITEKALDETIKRIEEKKTIEKPKPVVVKEVEPEPIVKTEPKKSIKDLVQSSDSSAPKGYFVQIGAFTKTPSNSYINDIRKAGFKYKIYKVEVKGKLYNKVLIGPYSSRATAKQNIEEIKKKLNLSSAYILKF